MHHLDGGNVTSRLVLPSRTSEQPAIYWSEEQRATHWSEQPHSNTLCVITAVYTLWTVPLYKHCY
jgi:hypothetical protein